MRKSNRVDPSKYGDTLAALRALVAQAERLGVEVVIEARDLEAGNDLDLEVVRTTGDGSDRWTFRRRRDPRREAIVRGLGKIPNAHPDDVAGGWSADRIAESILEELDRG